MSVRIACGSPYSPEGRLEDRLRRNRIGSFHALAPQQVPAEGVRDCQRMADRPVRRSEPAFEVGTPDRVGSLAASEWLGIRRRPPSPHAPNRHAMTAKQVSDRAGRRPLDALVSPLQIRQQLPRSPGHVPATQSYQHLGQLLAHLVGMPMRGAGQVVHPGQTVLLEPLQPLVPRRPTDPVPPAQLRLAGLLT